MRTSAAEYFTALSPVKDDGSKTGRGLTGRGGRCHCCPYGYHIDLDFVRYCHTLAKGCEEESATLRKLKQSKRQRRRETHSMEVMLGLLPQQQLLQNGEHVPQEGSTNKAPTPPPRRNSLKHLHNHLNNTNGITTSISTISTTNHYKSTNITTNGAPPPDVVRMVVKNNAANVNNNISNSSSATPSKSLLISPDRLSRSKVESNANFSAATDAFQEAMLDFEEALESSHEYEPGDGDTGGVVGRRVTLSPSTGPPSLDLLQHSAADAAKASYRKTGVTGPAQARPLVSNGVAMASILAQSAVNRVRSNSVTRSNSLPRYFPDEYPHAAWFSRIRPNNNTTNSNSSQPGYTAAQAGPSPGGLSLREALASLEAARGGVGGGRGPGGGVCSPPPPMDDVMSVTSAASQLSTSTLQSIRDQMATGLSRLRELEAEVRNIPHLQRELETLRAERQQRTADHRDQLTVTSRVRRRSQSPVRVNLEEFCSYRRARAGSVSDCSDTESVTSERRYGGIAGARTYTGTDLNTPKNSLFISEISDIQQQQQQQHGIVNRSSQLRHYTDDSDASRFSSRRSRRDASTMCKVLTRDVGIHHTVRVRSVGVMADLLPPTPVQTAVEKDTRDRSPKRDLKRPSLSSLFSVTRSTQTVEDKQDAKTKLLSTLGRQNSSIINRLAEVQKEAPTLTFDNSTNTEARHYRNQSCNTDQLRTRDQKSNTMLSSQQVMSRDDFDSEVNERVKTRVTEQLERAKKNWDLDFEDTLKDRLKVEMDKIEEKYKLEFEQEVEMRVHDKVRSELARAKQSIEQDINEEVDCRVTDEVARAKQRWEANQQLKVVSKPLTRDRSVQAAVPQLEIKPVEVKVQKTAKRSVAVGEGKLTDILCNKCILPKRSVGCSWDKVSDVVCDQCEERKHALSLKPITKSTSVQTAPAPITKVATNSSQTSAVSSKTVSTNTTFLALKKEEPITSASSPVLTPELERRPFGSSGVKICDKCHETIMSVAKDIVGTSIGSATLVTGPPIIVPLPPTSGSSKIPRLVDPFKLEPRLDMDEPLLFRRDSELRRSDSRIDQINASNRGGTSDSSDSVQLRRRTDQTPDLLSDSAIARDNRRNSGPSSIDMEKQKVPFIRQHTYTKLQDEIDAGTPKTGRKMSTFNEEEEHLTTSEKSKSTKTSTILPSKAKVNVYRRERSSPEITMKDISKQQSIMASEGRKASGVFSSKKDEGPTDSWQREMTNYSDDAATRSYRSASIESNATYKIEDDAKNKSLGTPPSPPKGRISPCPTRKVTPILQQIEAPASLLSSSSSPSKSSPVSAATEPKIPAIVKTSPPPQQQEQKEEAAAGVTTADTGHQSRHQSSTSIDQCDLLDSGDESVVTQSSSVYTAAGSQPRKKAKMGRNLRAALKVLNDSIGKPVRSGQQLTNALNIIQRDWFKVSSQTEANPHYVEDFLDIFEMQYSRGLLHRVVNLADVNGNTAMHYAVSHGNYDVVSLLLDSKVCSVNQQNKAGYTATMLVSLAPIKCSTHASVVERLFSMSDVNVKADQHGQTALMLAVSHGRLDTVRLLLSAGADVNIQDDDGSSALMCAAEHGHLAIVRLLLQCADTDAHIVDNDGSSALAIAVEAGHKDVGVLLYKHMNLARGSSPYSSLRGGKQRSRTPTLPRSSISTPPPRFSAPPSPGRSRRGSGPPSPPSHNSPHTPHRHKNSSASLSNLNI